MRELAGDIYRQRLLVEGIYQNPVDEAGIRGYFDKVTKALGLRMYAQPMIYSPGGEGREENQGFDAFVPLVDSGISLYVWTGPKFLSILIYSCKKFDEAKAKSVTRDYFNLGEMETKAF